MAQTVTQQNVPYGEAVGSLLYLANTVRLDISFAVNILSRHQINPTEEDWHMVKRVFRYLNGTRRRGLIYSARCDDLEAYSDASFADCKNSLTTCGYLIEVFGDTVMENTQTKLCHCPYVRRNALR